MKRKIISMALTITLAMLLFPCSVMANNCDHLAHVTKSRTWMTQDSSHSHLEGYDIYGNPITYPCMIMKEYREDTTYCTGCGRIDKKETTLIGVYHRRAY